MHCDLSYLSNYLKNKKPPKSLILEVLVPITEEISKFLIEDLERIATISQINNPV